MKILFYESGRDRRKLRAAREAHLRASRRLAAPALDALRWHNDTPIADDPYEIRPGIRATPVAQYTRIGIMFSHDLDPKAKLLLEERLGHCRR